MILKTSACLSFISLSLAMAACNSDPESASSEQSLKVSTCDPSFQAFGPNSLVTDVSADGSTAIGTAVFDGVSLAFRFDGALTPLPLPEGSFLNVATGVSADGAVIAGYGGNNPFQAVIWRGEEITPLGFLDPNNTFSIAEDISTDGKVVVGYSSSGAGFAAFRWDARQGMVDLGVDASDD